MVQICILFVFLFVGATSALTDIQILNFALNLEYLEATFYSYAATGKGLSLADRGGGPPAIGGIAGTFTLETRKYAHDIYLDELAHVRFLRAALGKNAVPAPLINIGSAFSLAADLAFNTTLKPAFNPYKNDLLFFIGAYIFEDVGVTAYKGAARFINDSSVLEAAAGILAVEAYHAGAIRSKIFSRSQEYLYPYREKMASIAEAVSQLRAAVSNVSDYGVFQNYRFTLVPGDEDAIAFSRSPQQVLPIVYLGGMNKGGFFPNGLNGDLK